MLQELDYHQVIHYLILRYFEHSNGNKFKKTYEIKMNLSTLKRTLLP